MGAIHRFVGKDGGFSWAGISPQVYTESDTVRILKHVLVGQAEGAIGFEMRFFEVPPGGRTTLDRHAHDHGVLILQGRGRLLLGDQTLEVGHGDVVYVGAQEVHQFECVGESALGFICVKSAGQKKLPGCLATPQETPGGKTITAAPPTS